MARQSTGTVVEYATKRGTGFALRFRAHGRRQYVTLGTEADGWTPAKAADELAYVLAQVRRGTWEPPKPASLVEVATDPTFHEFASEWFAGIEGSLRETSRSDYRWQLSNHLLPHFERHRLSEITVAEVDRYRQRKVREAGLSATSINKTITRLGQVLELAVERDLIARNPVRVNPRSRKVKAPKFRRAFLDDAAQVTALLDAAALLDAQARADRRHVPRRTLLATLVFTGLRIDELLELRWRHVDLASGRLRVGRAKTDAGVRDVTILPALRDELTAYKARCPRIGPGNYLFASATGRKLSDNNVRNRVLARAVALANDRLEEDGQPPLPESLTPHSMRHTFISFLFALGYDLPVVMAEVGHADPKVTLGIYAHVMRRDADARARLRALVQGADWTETGRNTDREGAARPGEPSRRPAESPY